jgi:MYXO-CTERM domain-containing protein
MKCADGKCPPPGIGKTSTQPGDGGELYPFSDGAAPGADAGGENPYDRGKPFTVDDGCSCRVTAVGGSPLPLLFLLLLLFATVRSRGPDK